MGLDITAYRRLERVVSPSVDEDGYPISDDEILIREAVVQQTDKDFPGRTAGIAAGVYRFADRCDFRAGSYGGYNAWRDALARFAGYGSARAVWGGSADSSPFFELINMSDCEGVIGPVVAAKLARDFAEHEERIIALAGDDDFFVKKYRDWRKAFEMAADGGAVNFH